MDTLLSVSLTQIAREIQIFYMGTNLSISRWILSFEMGTVSSSTSDVLGKFCFYKNMYMKKPLKLIVTIKHSTQNYFI